MDSIKWKCKNWIVYFKKFDNFHLIHLIVEKLDVFKFHPFFFSIVITNFTLTCEIWTHFLKKHASKVEILQRRKARLFIKRQRSGTSSDNEWYNEWQRVTTSGTTSDNEWYNEWQQMITNGNEWYNKCQRLTTSGTASDNKWQLVTSNDKKCNEW